MRKYYRIEAKGCLDRVWGEWKLVTSRRAADKEVKLLRSLHLPQIRIIVLEEINRVVINVET